MLKKFREQDCTSKIKNKTKKFFVLKISILFGIEKKEILQRQNAEKKLSFSISSPFFFLCNLRYQMKFVLAMTHIWIKHDGSQVCRPFSLSIFSLLLTAIKVWLAIRFEKKKIIMPIALKYLQEIFPKEFKRIEFTCRDISFFIV